MPQIKEYNSQISAPGPIQGRQASAEDFGSYTGAALGELGSAFRGAGDALQKRQEQEDITTQFKAFADFHAKSTQVLQERMKNPDPNDKNYDNFASSYMEEYQKSIDSMEMPKSPAARQYFERQSAELKQHFGESAIRIQAQLKGQKAEVDVTNAVSTLANTLQSRPADFELARTKTHQAIDEMVRTGLIGTPEAEKQKAVADTQLAMSAVYGWAKGDPAYAKELLDKDAFQGMFNPQQKHALYRDIHVQEEADRTAKRQAEMDSDRAKIKAAETGKTALVDKLLKDEPIDIQNDIVGNPNFTAQDKLSMFSLIKNKKTEFTDPAVFNDYFARVHQLDADHMEVPTDAELNQAVFDGKLTLPDLDRLRREMIGNNTVEGRQLQQQQKALFTSARQAYGLTGKGNIIADPLAAKKMESFTGAYFALKARAEKEKIPVTELFNPQNKDWYAGNIINQFYQNPMEVMKNRADMIGGSAKPSATRQFQTIPNPEAANDPTQPPELAVGNMATRGAKTYKEVLESEIQKATIKTKRRNPATNQEEDITIPPHPNRVSNITEQVKADYADWLQLQKDPINSTIFNPKRLYDMFGGKPVIKYKAGVPYVAGWEGGKQQEASGDKTIRPGESLEAFLKRMGAE